MSTRIPEKHTEGTPYCGVPSALIMYGVLVGRQTDNGNIPSAQKKKERCVNGRVPCLSELLGIANSIDTIQDSCPFVNSFFKIFS